MKIPFSLTAAVAIETRYTQMASALARGLSQLVPIPIDDRRSLSIAAYGPSLRDTWRTLTKPILSMSGATRWLAERGVVADYHIDMDPRASKVGDVNPPIPGVRYLMASVCHPDVFDSLIAAGADVTLWHTISSTQEADLRWLAEHDLGTWLIATGSNVGLAALQVGGFLGFRKFEIHGMDGSYAADGARHAGAISGKTYPIDQTWDAGGARYATNKMMANGVAETINAFRLYPIFCVLHGEGLLQALVAEEGLPNVCRADHPQVTRVRRATANFVEVPVVERSQVPSWSVWEVIGFANLDPHWMSELQEAFALAETRRSRARFNTGSVGLETGLLLRALCHWRRPRVIIEVGTFIGNSTVALQASERIYTCDRDNDCLPSTETIVTHPYMMSTAFLTKLLHEQITADLVFLDGRLVPEDVPLLLGVTTSQTVFVVDDYYEPDGKGVANVALLQPFLPMHGFVPPYPPFTGRSTLALLVPMRAMEIAA